MRSKTDRIFQSGLTCYQMHVNDPNIVQVGATDKVTRPLHVGLKLRGDVVCGAQTALYEAWTASGFLLSHSRFVSQLNALSLTLHTLIRSSYGCLLARETYI